MTDLVAMLKDGDGSEEQAVWGWQSVCRIADISYRQLDYWTTLGYLKPFTDANPGSGNERYYNKTELEIAKEGSRLIRAGFKTKEALEVARLLVVLDQPVSTHDGLITVSRDRL